MPEHRYAPDERRAHLDAYAEAAERRASALVGTPEAHAAPGYAALADRARRLLTDGFAADDLAALARATPRLFWTHREWMPPLVPTGDGRVAPPAWFDALDPLDRALADAAFTLRTVGTA